MPSIPESTLRGIKLSASSKKRLHRKINPEEEGEKYQHGRQFWP